MREFPIASVRPYVPVPAPAYVFLSGNQKFVAVKAPLDFFTPAQIDQFRGLGSIYYPEFIEKTQPFLRAAQELQQLLLEKPSETVLGPAPFEVSDKFLKIAGGLWSDGGVVEPFFVAIFAHELCGPLPGDQLEEVYSRSVTSYEQAILRSGWAVWQALHLGYLRLPWLVRLRDSVFRVASGQILGASSIRKRLPEEWMFETAQRELPLNGQGMDRTQGVTERLKLWSRGERLRTDLIQERDSFRSIFGPGGFRDG